MPAWYQRRDEAHVEDGLRTALAGPGVTLLELPVTASVLHHAARVSAREYIPGPPTSHHFAGAFVDRGGIVRALLARRRLRTHPPDFGNSTVMASVDLEEVT